MLFETVCKRPNSRRAPDATVFIGSIARKIGSAQSISVKLGNAQQAFDIVLETGYFRALRVLNCNADAGVLDLERIRDLLPLKWLASRNHGFFSTC